MKILVPELEFTYVQRYRDADHEHVELVQCLVLCQTVGDQAGLDKVHEVPIEAGVYQ